MDEEISWALPDDLEERDETPASTAPVRLGPPPDHRDQILTRVGLARLAVYDLVRSSVDEFERVAPWRVLYYPPQEADAFASILTALIELIESIPKRVAATLSKVPKTAPASDDEPTREDIRFMFSGIHHMVAHELKRLETTLAPVRERGSATADERQLLCELSADLKGKYASSMMGAAASLITQGLWNGVEAEPILFPEKAEEFRNTRELVDLLKEVSDAIKQLPEQVHFKELMEGWQQGQRVDQYALADLPSLRGKIAKLLKERTRRALYSGDYHQISRREVLLSERINELETLHQRTWATDHGVEQDLSPVYARLVQLTLEMAAVLDVTILKTLIGDKKVEGLRARVTSARTKPVSTASTPGAGLDSLIPLLAEDDLRIFLELLLGAVMRRASLTVTMREAEPAPAPAPTPSTAGSGRAASSTRHGAGPCRSHPAGYRRLDPAAAEGRLGLDLGAAIRPKPGRRSRPGRPSPPPSPRSTIGSRLRPPSSTGRSPSRSPCRRRPWRRRRGRTCGRRSRRCPTS